MQNGFRDWADVRVFLAVMRAGSTAAAAQVLGLAQTTVSRRIDALEHGLSLRLFERTTRGFSPTQAAGALLPAAEAIEAAAGKFEVAADRVRCAERLAPIRVTMWTDAYGANVAHVFTSYSAAHPEVTFEYIGGERPLDLNKGEADVALRLATRPVSGDAIRQQKLGSLPWTFYGTEIYAKKHGLPTSVEKIHEHQVGYLKHLRRDGPPGTVRLCETAADLIMLLLIGQVIAPMPILQGDNLPGAIRCFDPPERAMLDLLLLTSPQAHARPEVRQFTAHAAPLFKAVFASVGAVSR